MRQSPEDGVLRDMNTVPRSFRLFFRTSFAFGLAWTAACASPSTDGTQADDSDLKTKVQPTGGNGALDLLAPEGADSQFTGQFLLNDREWFAPGERKEKVPGTYTLSNRELNLRQTVEIKTGEISKYTLGGVRVQYAEPRPTLGDADVKLVSSTYGGTGAALSWVSQSPNGLAMYTLEGGIRVTTAADATPIAFTAAQGVIKDIVLPTAKVVLQLDSYDATYPTPSCMGAYVSAGAGNYVQLSEVRDKSGAATTWIVPRGSEAPVRLFAFGNKQFAVDTKPTVSGATITFALNRVEVDDVDVSKAEGGTEKVKGKVKLYKKTSTGSVLVGCEFPTQSGIDVPGGSYTVRSTAHTASGDVVHEAELTLP